MADGTSYTIDVDVQAASADPAAAKLAALAAKLEEAGNASKLAATSVEESQKAFKGAASASASANKQLESITARIAATRERMKNAMEFGEPKAFWKAAAALQNLEAKQVTAQAKVASTKTALDEQAAALEKVKASAESAAAAEAKLAKGVEWAKRALDESNKAQSAQAKESERAKKAEIAATEKLRATQAKAAQEALSAQAAQARAAAKQHADISKIAQATTKIGTGTGKVNEMAEAFGKLGGPLGVAGQKAFGAAAGFKKFKVAMGAAGPYVAIAVALVAIAAGVAAATVAAAVGIASIVKWGVQLADKEKRIDSITKKLQTNINKTFGGLKIQKLLDGMESLVDLFDESNASGRAMKVVFESLFQPLIDGAANFLPKIRTAFIQFEIMVLKALIAIKPFGSTILTVGKVVGAIALAGFAVLAVVLGAVIVSVGMLAVGFSIISAVIIAVGAGVVFLATKIMELSVAIGGAAVDAWNRLTSYFSSVSLEQIGIDLLMGLARGITGAGPAIITAITGAVGGAISAAKNLLGIASPSKVFAEIGMQTGEGMTQGVEGSAGDVQGSLESMVSPPSVQAPQSAPSASGAAGNTITIHINAAGGDAEGIAAAVRKAITDVLQGDAAQIAGAPA